MRLKVTVQRHGLPPTNFLWTTSGINPNAASPGSNTTVSQLLEQINEVIPLEATEWGLDDYVVEVQGFECLHFSLLDQVLKEDDTVVIKALKSTDQKLRKVSGRVQISSDGRHLIDGVPFGRPFLRIANRPPIHIPPRKRARLTYEQEGEDGSNDEVVISNQLVLHCSEDAEDTDESSEDGEYEGLDDELENELQYLVEDMEPAVEQQDAEPRITRSRKRRRGQGLGIEGSGMSTILSNDDSYFTNSQQVSFTQEAHINVPGLLCPAPAGGQRLKSRKEALHSQAPGRKRKVISRGSSRSSNKSVHFDGPELETPATIRMDRASQDSEDSGDENFKPASDLGSDNSEANKENVEPGPKKPKGKRANIKPMANPTVAPLDEETSSAGSSSTNSSSDSDSSSSADPDSDSDSGSSSDPDSDLDNDNEDDIGADEGDITSSEGISSSSDESSIDQAPQTVPTKKTKQTKLPAEERSSQKADISNNPKSIERVNELREATHNPSESTDNSASLPSVSTVSAPGQGLSKTRSRNQRRAAQKKRERLERVNGTIENITTENVTTENVTTENVTTDNADMADLPRYERIKKSTIEIDIDISDLLEKKRQALLEDVAQTKVKSDSRNESPDEEAGTPFTDEASNQPSTQEAQTSGDPKTLAIRTAEESSPVGPIPTSETPKPRARLDLQSTRRLLFGSLGVRNPKTPADEEKLRTKMMENVRKPIAKPVIQTPKPSVDDELIDDSWKDAIELKAVECCYDGVELTTPPFPFFQRWDAQQQGFGNRLNEERGKKRKRNHNQYYEDSQDIAENSFSRNFSTEGESINPPEESTNRSSQTDKNDASAPKCDLPTLPVDIDSYPLLTNGTALPGAIIAFKQMQCSEDTKWQPTISDYQAGIIDSVLDDGRFGVKLVNASQRSGKKRFDPQTGQRLYAKFEMPGVDDDTDEASGILELAFTDMIGAKLTKMAAEISKEPHDAEPHTTTSAADALVQTSPLQTAAEYNAANAASIKPNTPPRLDETANKEISVKASRQIPDLEDSILLSASVPSVDNTATLSPRAEPREEPAVSSQAPQSVSETTREEISALVKDAGFRSSVASEIREGLTVDLPAISVAIPPVAFDGNNSMIPTDSTDQVVSEDHNTRNQISSPFLSPSDAIDYSLGGETAVPTNDDSFLNDDDWESIESNDNAPLYPRLSSQIDNVEDVEEDSGPEDFQDAWENTNALNEESGSDFKPPKRRRSSRLSSSQEPQPIRSKGRGLRSKSMAMFSNADPSSSSPAPARATRSKTARNSKLFGSPSIKSSPLPSPRGSTLEASSSSKRLQTIQDEDSSDSLIEPSVLFREPRLPPPRRSQGTASASQSQRPPEGAKIIDLTGVSSDPVIPMNTPSPSKKASKGKKGKKSRKS